MSKSSSKPEGRLITRPEGIYRLLQRLSTKHSPIGLSFDSVADSYTSLILAVDFKEGYFLLDEVTPKWGDSLMAKAIPFTITAFYDGCKITIENLQVTGRAIKDDSPVYRVPFPKELYFLQRRQFFRAQIRLSLHINVQLGVVVPPQQRDEYDNLLPQEPHTFAHEGLLRDLSAQGCQVEVRGDITSQIEKNTCYPLCYVIFPNQEKLDLEITVRHLEYDPITKLTVLGCQFTQLDASLDRRISFLVTELQRDNARIASGNTSAPMSSLFVETEQDAEEEAEEQRQEVVEEKEQPLVTSGLKELFLACVTNVKDLVASLKERKPLDIKKTASLAKQLAEALEDKREELLILTRIRNPENYLYEHSVSLALLLADLVMHDTNNPKAKDTDYLANIIFAGMCHDLGKGLIPEKIYAKSGELSPAEYKIMHKHSLLTREILSRQPGTPEIALTLATQNCERLDGSGHPEGLRGISISPLGKLAAVIDVFDAMTNTRTYQQAMGYPKAYRSLLTMQSKLDQNLVKQLIRIQGIYPLGSLVGLENGDLGFVVEQNEDASPKKLRLVYNKLSHEVLSNQELNLNNLETPAKLTHENPASYAISPERALSG